MENGNILIGVLSIVACILPFIFMYRKSKKTERNLIKELKSNLDKAGLQLGKWGAAGILALGIDNKNQEAYFIKNVNSNKDGQYEIKRIQLANVSLCQVNREVRSVEYGKESDRVTHRLELCFYPKNGRGTGDVFILFDEDEDRRLSGEIQLAEEWSKVYSNYIGK